MQEAAHRQRGRRVQRRQRSFPNGERRSACPTAARSTTPTPKGFERAVRRLAGDDAPLALALDGTRTFRTATYRALQVISCTNPSTGAHRGRADRQPPSTRTRSSALLSPSITSARHRLRLDPHYWDTWASRSNTSDLKYRPTWRTTGTWSRTCVLHRRRRISSPGTLDFPPGAAGIRHHDYRLGQLSTITIGTSSRSARRQPVAVALRAEYIRSPGYSSPPSAVGEERHFNLSPTINTFTAVIGYSFNF